MRITEIKRTKKGRNALFCGDEFLFSIDDRTLLDLGVETGRELDERELAELRSASDLEAARQRALLILSIRPHSFNELKRKLERHFDRDTAAAAADKMLEWGYLNDRDYADSCVECVCEPRCMSLMEAGNYLREHGVDRDTAETALFCYGEGERSRLERLVEKKYSAAFTDPAAQKKATAALARRGFSLRDIRAVLGRPGQEDYYNE